MSQATTSLPNFLTGSYTWLVLTHQNSSNHAKRQLSQSSKLGTLTVIVDGQKFTEREILLRYGTPADTQNPERSHALKRFEQKVV
jgi:hypothetical protein